MKYPPWQNGVIILSNKITLKYSKLLSKPLLRMSIVSRVSNLQDIMYIEQDKEREYPQYCYSLQERKVEKTDQKKKAS